MFPNVFTLALALAAAAASAASIPRRASSSEPPLSLADWSVTNFDHGCSPGGCVATYNLSAPAGYVGGAPGFAVSCAPVYIQGGWRACEPASSGVEAVWETGADQALIYVKAAHVWYQGETRYNATADTAVEPAATAFVLPVHSLSAVL